MTDNKLTLEQLNAAGLEYIKLKDFEQAAHCFEKALVMDPKQVAPYINLGNIYLSLGQFEKAKQYLHQALRLDPHHAEGYNNLGRLLYLENLFDDAIPYFEKALRINPDYWEAHYNLAHGLAQKNQFKAASIHYREVLRLLPKHAIAHFNLGLIYFEEGNFEAALTHLQNSITDCSTDADSTPLYYIAHAHLALGHVAEAIPYFEKLLNASTSIHLEKPGNKNLENLGENHHNLAVLYLRQENHEKALFHFEQALMLQPNNDTAKHMVMALKGIQSEDNAPKQYITELFDQYADYYDLHVKEKLHYKVPGLLRNAIGRCRSPQSPAGRILDLGCGTGLCGVYFRDLAIELIGVDLSPKMVEKAKALGAYESVVVADIQDYLNDLKINNSAFQPFDLIVAGDVLVYLGNLENIFQGITAALRPKGRFVFTTENINNETDDYLLKPSGRYAHASDYVHRLADANQLTIELEEAIVPREHEGKPIDGRLYVLQRNE